MTTKRFDRSGAFLGDATGARQSTCSFRMWCDHQKAIEPSFTHMPQGRRLRPLCIGRVVVAGCHRRSTRPWCCRGRRRRGVRSDRTRPCRKKGSGEHRPVDVNALVEESLNLAYHGARAENQSFKINMERSLDSAAGQVDVYPQEITRALLNLISNGFYAATKRKGQSNSDAYEPTLTATTKDLGARVEIRIRDSGVGIPPEVKEKMFNPFFTTKPAGEGTGLGLSITHDIIVKQHSGSIEVDTQPGEFTEIRIVLPRAGAFIAESRGRA